MRAAVSTWLALLLLLPAAAQTGRPPAGKPAAKPSAGAKPATPAVSGPDLPSRLPGTAPFCVVNGEKIPLSTYVDRLSLTYAPQMRELLILETLLRQECKARKVSATPEEVAAVTQKALEDHARRNNGMAGLTQELLRTRGWSVADFRRVIRDQAEGQILRDKLGTVLVKASDVKDTDLEPLYQQRREAFRQPDRVRMSHILIRRPPDAD
ncbi:MAG: hypothetical protein FJX77_16185, partial [Armatimonadetes bacterium]|nr:hypothetical protein [Armatimonadota bacterium]